MPMLSLSRAAAALACAGAALWAVSLPSTAQVPPSAAEAKAYQGLHRAAWRGDLPELKRLIAQSGGTSLEVRDAYGRTPLQVATYARQREAIRLLAQAGASLNAFENDRYDAVTIAAVADDTKTLAVLLELGASAGQTTSRYDGTALIAAAHLGHDEIVRQLIAAKAPLDHVNNLHWTALIESIVLGDGGPRHQRTLALLVDAGANLQLADREGRTPLQLASARGYTAMENKLKAAGAR
ncbi:ankyrin repeat domain-containing protein [Variovorax soli]|uniref:ankyrin repeat domain-containing protein n=1 Tax=Variovorax soli TaxID=376815 RepID=UPI0009FFD50A|nr:ankyrin repeat domain-containing protein [Variovorax soli]